MRIECRTMGGAERIDAFALMRRFRSDEAALGAALALFADRPDFGFVWLAYDENRPLACASVSFAISTESGGVVATVHDVFVAEERRREGIASALLATLHGRLAQLDVARIDAAIPDDAALRAFFAARGYEERAERVLSFRR